MEKSIDVANYFLQNWGDISPMKLIKLTYIAHGWHLGIIESPLIDENAEAWKYGPVIPSLYHKYKIFGGNSISFGYDHPVKFQDEKVKDLLNKIWEVYGGLTGVQLSAKTHKEGTPWSITWDNVKKTGAMSLQISDDLIKSYYQSLMISNQTETENA